MQFYFAYGSNMNGERLRARVPQARAIGAVSISGWRLAFNKPGRDGSGKANLVADSERTSWGVLYELPTDGWSILDRFEPGYEHASFRLEDVRGGVREAGAYLFPCPAAEPSLSPSAAYLELMLAGAREHRLPPSYIERIRSFGT